jgi:hypothetical protein
LSLSTINVEFYIINADVCLDGCADAWFQLPPNESRKGDVNMRFLSVLISLIFLAIPVWAGTIEEEVAELKIPQEKLMSIGESIYNTEGANTCLKCHGKDGHGGDQAGAADLRHPRTWRSYQALGGDEAFEANKEKFLQDLQTAVIYLIRDGATTWNLKFDREHPEIKYDWSKVSVPDKADKYNNMMKGLTSGPMRKHVSGVKSDLKLKKTSQAKDVAAVADFMYVKSLDDGSDKGGVFK